MGGLGSGQRKGARKSELRVSQSFSLSEARLLHEVVSAASMNGDAYARLQSKVRTLHRRAEGEVARRKSRAEVQAQHERILADYAVSAANGEPWSNSEYAARSGLPYSVVTAATKEARLIAGLTYTKAPNASKRLVEAAYVTLREANKWGPWQVQPLAELVGLTLAETRKAIKAAVRRFNSNADCERWPGGATALLREINGAGDDAEMEAAE